MSKPFVIGARIRSNDELRWARDRPMHMRPPLPAVGDRVLYRSNDFFVQLKSATVLEVRDKDLSDVNLVQWNRGQTALEPTPDPWPLLLLKVDGMATLVETREARLEGSAGWLPTDWQRWPRPHHDINQGEDATREGLT